MSAEYNEDLFESTKMTFGEHLEELRRSLFKALAALVIGTLVGLLFARDVVDYVQTPLRRALVNYYQEKAERDYLRELKARQDAGLEVPADLEAAADLFSKNRLLAERRLIHRDLLVRLLGGELAVPPEDETEEQNDTQSPRREDLVPITLYHTLEDDPRIQTMSLGMEEPFVVWMKAGIVVGIVLSSPLVFYFIWAFVAAGLYPHERKYVHIFLPFSIGLFLLGAGLAFFVVFRFVLNFLLKFNAWMGINPSPRITEWLNFVLMLPVGFGIGFQLPLVMLFLERIGIFSVAIYRQHWRISVLIISVLSMLLTPADWQSMIFMFTSLTMLYFGGILLCMYMPRRRTPFGDEID